MSMRDAMITTTAAVSFLMVVSASGAFAQQSAAQQKCLNAVNKDGAAVARTQGKENVACLKGAGTQLCLTADAKSKVLKAKNKTAADATKSCGTPPDFGYTSAAIINGAASQGEIDLTADVFGPDLGPAVIGCNPNKAGCACQQKILKTVEQLASVKLAEFVKCKKAVLEAGTNSAAGLVNCIENPGTPGSIAADTKGKIAKTLTSLNAAITKTCTPPGSAFPGNCTAFSGAALANCLDTQVECRVCQIIKAMDGLSVDCDLFDDGLLNTSCVVPVPVPGLKGALPATAGRFNYNLTPGLPGANAACNTNFAGTHACTYAELQSAEAAGQLVGLKDTTNVTVTAFWAIDSSQPALQQCQDDVFTFLNWEYGTAHTASRGQKVNLTNLTGVLGALQSSLQCNFSTAWVGCCQ
jgi:hypothetical protein